MTDEQHRIRAHIESSAPPLDIEEVTNRRASTATTRLNPRSHSTAAGARPPRLRFATAAVALVLVAGAVVALAVTGDRSGVEPGNAATSSEGSAPEITDPTMSTAPPPTLAPPPAFDVDFSARGMLAEIPSEGVADGGGLLVAGTDLARISASAGVERTGAIDMPEPQSPWIDALFVQRSFSWTVSDVFLRSFQDPEEFEAEVGFAFLDIDRFATASKYVWFEGPNQLQLPFDLVVLRSDITELTTAAGEDHIIDVGAGADGERNIDERTPLRPIGRPLRVGVAPDGPLVGMSKSRPYVEAWLDADAPTLAEVPDLAEAAAVLDTDTGLYTAQIDQLDRDIDLIGPEQLGNVVESDLPIVEKFTTIGMGWSGSGADQQTSIVYVFADASAAAASLEPIDGLFSSAQEVTDVFTVDAVTVAGRCVLVRGSAAPGVPTDQIRQVFLTFSPVSIHR